MFKKQQTTDSYRIKEKYDELYEGELLKKEHDWRGSNPLLHPRSYILRVALPKHLKQQQALILDIGTGIGYSLELANEVLKGDATLIGSDLSINALRRAKVHAPVFCADATRLPVKDGVIDNILCLDVIEHIPHRQELFNELARLLKKGGKLFISVPNKYYLFPLTESLSSIKSLCSSFQPYDATISYFELKSHLRNKFTIEECRTMSVISQRIRRILPFTEGINSYLAMRAPLRYFGQFLVVVAKKV